MQTRVTAILVARFGAAPLDRTLAGIAAQTRPVDQVIAVDAGSSDGAQAKLAASGPTQLVTVPGKATFGAGVAAALRGTVPESEDEWLWLLAHDNTPEPTALAQLLGAVEIAPSVAIAGPKLMRAAQPDVIAEFGETLTRYGKSVALVEGELDQGQHDVQDDVLGVAAGGMLVRRSVWAALGGFDPGLPSIDASLDFSIRARLAGFRVVVVPGAKVSTAGGPELFGRKSISERRRARMARAAQLHRRLVYSPPAALLFHWLSLLPLAIIRSIGQLLAKRPGFVGGEFTTALGTAFGGSGVLSARRNLRRSRSLGWASVSALRMPGSVLRERRGQAREEAASAEVSGPVTPSAGFVANGGLWVVVVAALAGVIAWGPILAAGSLRGGGLAPLSGTVAELWTHVGYGWREIGVGFTGAADPFAYLLAILGSITFWNPSTSLVLVWVLALPLAALGAFFAARRVTTRLWLPALAALLWAASPALLGSLTGGHPGAVLAHLLLPWLMLASLNAPRSWAAAAGSALLFAAVAAASPLLIPALLLGWLALLASHPTRIVRLIGIPIPAAALFGPLVVQQVMRGNPVGLFAEPGVPAAGSATSGFHLALGDAGTNLHGWDSAVRALSLPGSSAPVVVAALLATLAVLALLSLFLPGSRRSIPALILALVGFATAVASSHVAVSAVSGTVVPVWSGAALSLFWLGLVVAALSALDNIGRASAPLGLLAGATVVALGIPLLGASYFGTTPVTAATRILPAIVTAGAAERPRVATLVLTPRSNGALGARIEHGSGSTLDDQSTLDATRIGTSATDRRIATLAGNLASHSGFDASADLASLDIGYVLLAPSDGHPAVHRRASQELDSTPLFEPVGSTANGLLWRTTAFPASDPPTPPGNLDTRIGVGILAVQGLIFAMTLLLGIPTRRRRRRAVVSGSVLGEPATTFENDGEE